MIGRALFLGLVALAIAGSRAAAQPAPPAPHDPVAFDFMNLLADRGLHDLGNERWNAYGQVTYITTFKLPFATPYTNANGSNNSFGGDYERSFTLTASLFLGARLWGGGELYFAPEMIGERALSRLRGIGGATEIFELQKTGTEVPLVYRSRFFLRQTFDLGGATLAVDSNPLVLGTQVHRRRLVFTFGNYSVLDVMDRNGVTGDPRQTFFNEAFMTHPAYDFPADARGFTVGLAAELYWDDWAVRVGRFLPPVNPNEQSIEFRFWDRYGDTIEIEHDHRIRGLAGAVRLLGFRNHVLSGRFDDAIAAFQSSPTTMNAGNCGSLYNYGSANFNAPDLCWARRLNVKYGVGINVEQYVARDVGLFLRAMYTDGQSEVDAYDSSDASFEIGGVAKGTLWRRPFDVAGVGLSVSFISDIHARYLALGGVDGFIGDGHLKRAEEGLFEAFYSVNLFKAIWLAGDYQLLWNPGYNADRPGPVHLLGAKVHAEF